MSQLIVLDPEGEVEKPSVARPPHLGSLAGGRVGFMDNHKSNANELLNAIVDHLTDRTEFAIGETGSKEYPNIPAPDGLFDALLGGSDALLVGTADCGSCTAWAVLDAVALAKRGVPTVVISTTKFAPFARAQAEAMGAEWLPVVALDHPIGGSDPARIAELAEAAWPQVHAALTGRAPGTSA